MRSSLTDVCRADAQETDQPEYREELVCTLIEILLNHPQSIIHRLEAAPEDASHSMLATIQEAARVQHAGSLVDWLGAARIALQVATNPAPLNALSKKPNLKMRHQKSSL